MSTKDLSSMTWGRSWEAGTATSLGILFIFFTAPLFVLYMYVACFWFQGALWNPFGMTLNEVFSLLPPWSWTACLIYAVWFIWQFALSLIPDVLHRILPNYEGGERLGAVTPAGNQLPYQINGLQAWVITHIAFLLATYYFHWFSPTIIIDYWGPLLWVTTAMGMVVALFVYIKAFLFPSFPNDRKFSGNALYDFYMGIEMHPRIGNFDFKLFFNGRPGIVAWTLINLSYAAKQFELYGTVTNSMILVNVLQALYVLYFFWNESWYLHTIDIAHDHFGWMLAWGDCCWLPYVYTLQGLYLVYHPVELSTGFALFVLALGLAGYAIFHSSNRQKDRFRRIPGSKIWGREPEYVSCKYTSADGAVRQSKLLTSGWWGVSRHFNYVGDLMGCLAYSLACGFDHVLPYFYFVYMTILLVHRIYRDEDRLSKKYGEGWRLYCQKVRWRMIPGVY